MLVTDRLVIQQIGEAGRFIFMPVAETVYLVGLQRWLIRPWLIEMIYYLCGVPGSAERNNRLAWLARYLVMVEAGKCADVGIMPRNKPIVIDYPVPDD